MTGIERYNINVLDAFIDNVNSKASSHIRIMKYDEMGGNVIEDIYYIREQDKFILCTDWTRSEFALGHTYNYCEYLELVKKGDEGKEFYCLTNASEIAYMPDYYIFRYVY